MVVISSFCSLTLKMNLCHTQCLCSHGNRVSQPNLCCDAWKDFEGVKNVMLMKPEGLASAVGILG